MRTQHLVALLLAILLATAFAEEFTFNTKNADKPFANQEGEDSYILISGGTVVNADHSAKADVLIHNDKIVRVGQNIEAPKGTKVVDATDRLVMPGGIDPHTHMEMPFMGTMSADDFFKGSAAALAGGTTMIIDFAIPSKGKSLLDAFENYQQKAAKAPGNYGFHMAVIEWTDQTEKDMAVLAKKGINSFKVFMAYKGALMLNDEGIYKAFKTAKKLGCVPMVHAENGDLVLAEQERVFSELGITGPEGHPLSRPAFFEAEATNRAITIARTVNVPLYIVHVMSAEAMEHVNRAKLRGQRVIGEPVVSGLVLDDSYYRHPDWHVASRYVMSPPLRPKGNDERLRNALASGILDLVATDHCVFNSTQKLMGRDDFRKIPNGLNGVEDRLSIVWDRMVKSGLMTKNDFVRVTSTKAAQIFNVYPRKGVVREGSDADVIVFNPNAKRTISAETHHHNIDWNVYEGWEVTGVVETTIVNGHIAYSNGKLNVAPGQGRFVETPPFGYLYDTLDAFDAINKPTAVDRS